MKTIGIIPARAGSKGIIGKNKKLLCGKPLIQYTLEAAISSNLDEIVVSTDDDEIINIAASFNIKSIIRPESLSGDHVPTISVIVHAIESIYKHFDAVMTLQPTSPLRTTVHINQSLQLFSMNPEADSLVSVVKVPHNFLPTSLMKKDGEWLENYTKNADIYRRQDKPTLYARNGAAIYITSIKKISDYIVGGNIIPYEMNRFESIDIDDMEDWDLAELLIQNKF